MGKAKRLENHPKHSAEHFKHGSVIIRFAFWTDPSDTDAENGLEGSLIRGGRPVRGSLT